MATNEENSWRTTNFRQSVVAKIEEAIRSSGLPTSKNSMEMENHVFQKAKTKEEYLGFVARLILHVREMNSKKNPGMGGPAGAGPNMQDPINALQTLARQGSGNPNQMMGLVPPQGPSQVTATNLLQTLNQRPGNQPRMPSPGQANTLGQEILDDVDLLEFTKEESLEDPVTTDETKSDSEVTTSRGEKRSYADWSNKSENKAFAKYVAKSLDKMSHVDAIQAHTEIQAVLAKYSLRKYDIAEPSRSFSPRGEWGTERPLGLLKTPIAFKPRLPGSSPTPRGVIRPMETGEPSNPRSQGSLTSNYF